MSILPCWLVKGFGIESVFILLVQVDTLKATELSTYVMQMGFSLYSQSFSKQKLTYNNIYIKLKHRTGRKGKNHRTEERLFYSYTDM